MPITIEDIINFKNPPKAVKPIKKWLGNQTHCDICEVSFKDVEWFADARLYTGQWALMCPDCYEIYAMYRGRGFGVGKGQKYDSKTKIKLEG